DTDENGNFGMRGGRPDADFSNLRWCRLPRFASDAGRCMGLRAKDGEPGVFVAPRLAAVDLVLKVDPALEGAQVCLMEEDEDQRYARPPFEHVDHRGEIHFGPQFEGVYRAVVLTVDHRKLVLDAFTLRPS